MRKVTDENLEIAISIILRTGVSIAGAVVFLGGIVYLLRHGGQAVNYGEFHGETASNRQIGGIVAGALAFQGRSIIQLGVLLLIATPIVRVAFSMVGFAIERDRTYVLITAIVLAVLIFGLISGAIQG
ncbi:MAG TPA: DUF1634 domain-containing protein [Bryobacteraceae bacterium]|jgi:uncharacterized membrane protein|nr:DUF1634 domain-containing protein [Bryobacteraceae bacterium]